MLFVGYLVFWFELYVLDTSKGSTSIAGWLIFAVLSVISLFQCRKLLISAVESLFECSRKRTRFEKLVILLCSIACVFIIGVTVKASFLPPHFPQEYDTINYHITLPRQHLINNSFDHLSWSAADLYFMPIDVALSPFWLSTELPNKIPQIFFVFGLMLVVASIFNVFNRDSILGKFFIVFAILGSHNISIQMGVGMLDIAICYLFFAAVDSWLRKDHFLALVEFNFLFWSKSFMPIMMSLLIVGVFIAVFALKSFGFKKVAILSEDIQGKFKGNGKGFIVMFLAVSMVIGGPFIAKSIKYTGSPLFPFFVGDVNLNPNLDGRSDSMVQIQEVSKRILNTKDQYGSGRGPAEFLKHLWLISVPEKDVNKRCDYPIGLPYLLCFGPFVYLLFDSLKKKRIELCSILIFVYWVLWWMGSQQTRFLYIPIICMYMLVISQKKFLTGVFQIGILISLLLISISVFRAHKGDLGKSKYEVLRQKDRDLLAMAKDVDRSKSTKLSFEDAAFANFPIVATNHYNSVFVLKTK